MAVLPFTRPTIDEATIAAVVETLRSGWLASGPRVLEFERKLSDYVGGRPVRVVTSATEALEIALLVCGIGPGDEVITPAMSFAATANVICRVGARPVFVDVGLASRNIDIEATARAITPQGLQVDKRQITKPRAGSRPRMSCHALPRSERRACRRERRRSAARHDTTSRNWHLRG